MLLEKGASRPFSRLSVVIPVGPGEGASQALLPDLARLEEAEIIWVVPESTEPTSFASRLPTSHKVVNSEVGRAQQLNAGARSATRETIWFLHADSRFARDTLVGLEKALSLTSHGDAMAFFRLKFLDDGPLACKLNEMATYFRSTYMGMPFGDQGFVIARNLFFKLGGYRENVPYGEDHLLAWSVRQNGMKLEPLAASLFTSARKYKQKGWSKTTANHVYLTYKQAGPEWLKLWKGVVRRPHEQ